jgi:hypothetical protein
MKSAPFGDWLGRLRKTFYTTTKLYNATYTCVKNTHAPESFQDSNAKSEIPKIFMAFATNS